LKFLGLQAYEKFQPQRAQSTQSKYFIALPEIGSNFRNNIIVHFLLQIKFQFLNTF
jgi:hypothetical protein